MSVPAVSDADVLRWAVPFADLVDTVRRHTRGTASWSPTWRSEGAQDVAAAAGQKRPSGATWGTNAGNTVFAAAALLMDAAQENAAAVQSLLAAGATSTLVMDTLARAVLEASSQVWWLLQPGIGGRARVARLYVLRRQSAAALEDTAGKMRVQLTPGYGDTIKNIDTYYRDELGLAQDLGHKGGWTGCEGQKALGYTDRVALFMRQIGHDPDKGAYAFCCGASHTELWRLQYGYATTVGPNGQAMLIPRAARDFVRAAVSICIDALVYPATQAFNLLDRGAARADVARLVTPLRAAMRV